MKLGTDGVMAQARPKKSRKILTHQQQLSVYRTMLMSRRLDDLEIHLKRLNRVFFQISGAGHEATQVAAAMHLRPGYDWFFPYYRDRALCLALGVTPTAMLLQAVGATADPASGGRQMPSHWGDASRHIVSESSATGTQYLNAVGCAEGGMRWPLLDPDRRLGGQFFDDEVVYVSSGDGTTSEGAFFEALNTACNLKLPVVFHVEDNGYAISVPIDVQTAGGSISKLTVGYPDLLRLEFDGCDPEASFQAWQQGVAYARARRGPVLMHAHVIRPYSHSMSDDERLYRPAVERAEQAKRDPLITYRDRLLRGLDVSEAALEEIERSVKDTLEQARAAALVAPAPAASSAAHFVFSPDVDPTSERFSTAPATSDGEPKTMVDMIRLCLADEMARDARIVVFGEDVADASHEAIIDQVAGKGGVFKVSAGLQRRFGGHRVFNTPLAEANIVGRALGMALRGLRPVAEVQFFDYIWPAMMQLRNEVALLRWRSNNAFKCPMVIRSAYGGYLKGGAIYHSQTGESIFAHCPGLRVVLPSNALDANGLLRTAIRCDDPVLFLEHKHLYRQTHNRAPYPGPDFMIPFGKANTVRTGSDITLVTYGALVKRSMDAAERARQDGIEVEVIDLRTIVPYDWQAIAASVRKTGRMVVVHEESVSFGVGAELAARVAGELFDYLDAPVLRVGSLDTFVGYSPDLEDAILPQVDDVLASIQRLAAY